MTDKGLDKPKQEWIESLLNQWGAWVFSGLDFDSRINMIARLMRSVDPSQIVMPEREMCGDELGLLISSVVGNCIKNPCLQDFRYLEAKYVYCRSIYAIAKYMYEKDKSVEFVTWKARVRKSIKNSERKVAKSLDHAIKNHKNANKLRKFALNV